MMMEPLLQIDNLTKEFDLSQPFFYRFFERQKKKILRAVHCVNLSLERGTVYGLVGESGSGKSTIAKLITNLLQPTSGSIYIQGKDIHKEPHHRYAQMVFQDPYASLNPRWKVRRIILEPLVHEPHRATKELAGDLLEKVGLSGDDMHKYPHQFSGGQRQRIGIARVLASNPELIVCDELTSALDVSVQAQVLNLMQEVQKEFSLTYVFISHDLSVVRHISDTVGVLYLGNLIEEAPTETLFTTPHHPYTQMLLDASPTLDGYKRKKIIPKGEIPDPMYPPSGCPFHPRCPKADDLCKTEKPQFRKVGTTKVACHHSG